MPHRQQYNTSLAVRALVWPLSFAVAAGYLLATRTVYRAAISLLPDRLVWAAIVTAVATLVRWIVLTILDARRPVEAKKDDTTFHRTAA
jgi:hypothetical protein